MIDAASPREDPDDVIDRCTTTLRARLLALACGLALVWGLAGCATQDRPLTGRVDSTTVTAQAPALSVPQPDLDAGFPDTAATNSSAPSPVTIAAASRVRTVEVAVGAHVQAGDRLVVFDDGPLAAQVAKAKADQRVAESQPAVLSAAIADTYDKEATIEENRTTLTDAIATLTSTRAQLADRLAQATRTLPQLRSKRAEVRAARAALPSQARTVRSGLRRVRRQLTTVSARLETLTTRRSALAYTLRTLDAQIGQQPGGATAPQRAQRTQLVAAIASLDSGIGELRAGRARLTAARDRLTAANNRISAARTRLATADRTLTSAIRRLTAAIPTLRSAITRIDDGLAKARSGLARLATAQAKLREARARLRDLRELARIAARASRIGVDIARHDRGLTVVTAPATGVVLQIARTGDVLAPGAPVAVIRPDGAPTVTSWIAPDQVDQFAVGTAVRLHGDWMPAGQSIPARVTRVGARADYPPTYQATDGVHLTRAVEITVTVDGGDSQPLPAGVPLEITKEH